ncbi:ABC transporter ATP-binding protein [Thermostilla marina]
MAVLEVEHVVKEYRSGSRVLRVLDDISFSLNSGGNLAIVGPSGSGKSTLLNIIGGLDRPTQGAVRLDDDTPATMHPEALARFRNRRVGFVFQEHHLLPQCTVLENVLVPTLADGAPTSEDVRLAEELLERVGLQDRTAHLPGELSGGERQRTAIARALIRKPDLLLADEPTGNLDRSTADQVADLLLELHRSQQAILIVVTHSLRLAEKMQRTAELDAGKLNISVPS